MPEGSPHIISGDGGRQNVTSQNNDPEVTQNGQVAPIPWQGRIVEWFSFDAIRSKMGEALQSLLDIFCQKTPDASSPLSLVSQNNPEIEQTAFSKRFKNIAGAVSQAKENTKRPSSTEGSAPEKTSAAANVFSQGYQNYFLDDTLDAAAFHTMIESMPDGNATETQLKSLVGGSFNQLPADDERLAFVPQNEEMIHIQIAQLKNQKGSLERRISELTQCIQSGHCSEASLRVAQPLLQELEILKKETTAFLESAEKYRDNHPLSVGSFAHVKSLHCKAAIRFIDELQADITASAYTKDKNQGEIEKIKTALDSLKKNIESQEKGLREVAQSGAAKEPLDPKVISKEYSSFLRELEAPLVDTVKTHLGIDATLTKSALKHAFDDVLNKDQDWNLIASKIVFYSPKGAYQMDNVATPILFDQTTAILEKKSKEEIKNLKSERKQKEGELNSCSDSDESEKNRLKNEIQSIDEKLNALNSNLLRGLNAHSKTAKSGVNIYHSECSVSELDGGSSPQKSSVIRHAVLAPYGIEDPAEQAKIAEKRAKDVLKAMVLGDPALLQQIEDNTEKQTITLNAASLSMLTPDEFRNFAGKFLSQYKDAREKAQWEVQYAAWQKVTAQMSSKQGLELDFSDLVNGVFKKEGDRDIQDMERINQLRQKKFTLKGQVMAFNFGVNAGAVGIGSSLSLVGGWDNVKETNEKSLKALIGSLEPKDGDVGGFVGEALESLNQELEGLNAEKDSKKIADINQKIADIKILVADIRTIWQIKSYMDAGQDPYKMVRALNQLCDLVGVKVAMNCKSGKDRTGMLDSLRKADFLTKIMENRVFQSAEKFTTSSLDRLRKIIQDGGSAQIQRVNTGWAGSKLKNVQAVYNMVQDFLTRFLGGSAHTKE